MDAHAFYPPSYVPRLIAWQDRTGADNVGGVWVTLPGDESVMARAIATGLAHPFGVGNAYYRIGTSEPRWVDTVPFGCYRREIFSRIGDFDEELLRNQDDEFNMRLVTRGGRILLVPEIVSHYYARTSLGKLWRTYEQYGYFKPLVARKLGRILTIRQVVPVGFVTALLGSAALAPWSGVMRVLALGLGTAYAAAVAGHAVTLGRAEGFRTILALCLVFPVIHLSYALGWIRGIIDFLVLRRRPAGARRSLERNR
jgi:GT2 family glycosyltransferase